MTLELHIWGPAFGLPSIDAQCLATVAYLVHAVPRSEWVLVASSDPAVCPTQELPALRHGSLWISRFRNIVDYLRKYSNGDWDLDTYLDKRQRADRTAFSSFIESQGQPLIDLSLYVSSENYTTSTRGAYGEILQWPGQWITPPKVRAAAKLRAEHLGLSSLDLDSTQVPEKKEEAPGAGQIPKSLLTKPKETVTSFLGKSTQRSQIRLDAIASQFFGPLEELLGENRFFFTKSAPSSLDCLVVGYLALAIYPDLPHQWLKTSLVTKFPALAKNSETFSQQTFGPPVAVKDAIPNKADNEQTKAAGKTVASSLPWQSPDRPSVAVMGSTVLENMIESTPILNEIRANSRIKQAASDSELDEEERQKLARVARYQRNELYSQIAYVVAGVSAFVGYLAYEGMVSFGSRGNAQEDEGEKKDFGEAGAMLGI